VSNNWNFKFIVNQQMCSVKSALAKKRDTLEMALFSQAEGRDRCKQHKSSQVSVCFYGSALFSGTELYLQKVTILKKKSSFCVTLDTL